MHRFKRIAVAIAATSLAGLGMVAANSGTALAAPGPHSYQSVTGCSTTRHSAPHSQINCTAGTSTVFRPTAFKITVDESYFHDLDFSASPVTSGRGIFADWHLVCSVDGHNVYRHMHHYFSVHHHGSYTFNPWFVVGSPVPNSCTIIGLTAQTRAWLSTDLVAFQLGHISFTLAINAYARTLVGGAIWQNAGTTSAGATAVNCADVLNNGNSGTPVQNWMCLSDLSQFWARTVLNQFVHNGVCMTATGGGYVVLAHCFFTHNSNQRWRVLGNAMHPGEITSRGRCLTAPLPLDGIRLRVLPCTGAANQMWVAPPYPV